MTEAETRAWFDELHNLRAEIVVHNGFLTTPQRAHSWIVQARTAVAQTLPPGHVARLAFETEVHKANQFALLSGPILGAIVGAFEGCRALVNSNRLRGVLDGVRAETVSELLDQATQLSDPHVVAATVIAGGALETHLLHVCTRNAVAWTGPGSIAAYDQAIGTARKAGATIYSLGDSKLVLAWGDDRNGAAHAPTKFQRTVPEVRLMIEGIRQFVARNP